MNKKLNYYLKLLNKAENKSVKLFEYLQKLETQKYNKELQININRLCVIDEIISQLIICLQMDLEKEKHNNE